MLLCQFSVLVTVGNPARRSSHFASRTSHSSALPCRRITVVGLPSPFTRCWSVLPHHRNLNRARLSSPRLMLLSLTCRRYRCDREPCSSHLAHRAVVPSCRLCPSGGKSGCRTSLLAPRSSHLARLTSLISLNVARSSPICVSFSLDLGQIAPTSSFRAGFLKRPPGRLLGL
jgi:hypothetical protein